MDKKRTERNLVWVLLLVAGCFVLTTLLVEILHLCKINIFKIIVLFSICFFFS